MSAVFTAEDVELLHRWSARLCYDPGLLDALHGGEPLPGLPDALRDALRGVARGAWATDPERRNRALDAAVAAFPVSIARVGLAGLDAFFGTRFFHDAVMERGSLVLGFGRWLVSRGIPEAPLELGIADARRDPPQRPDAGAPGLDDPRAWVRLAAGVRVVRTLPGVYVGWLAVREQLGTNPLAAIAAGRVYVPDDPVAGRTSDNRAPGGVVGVLAVRKPAGMVTTEALPDGLLRVAVGMRTPMPAADARAWLVQEGAESDAEALEVLLGLAADGVVVAVAPPPEPGA